MYYCIEDYVISQRNNEETRKKGILPSLLDSLRNYLECIKEKLTKPK